MKEMMKSKLLIGFIVLMLGFTYMKSLQTIKLEEDVNHSNQELISLNMD